jgi:hypothetical protein
MFRHAIVSRFALLAWFAASAAQLVAADESASLWQQDGWPLVQQFCLDCHHSDSREGELDLSGYEKLGALRGAVDGGASMQRVLEMVRFGAMPPEDAVQPTSQQRKRLVAALDQALFAVSCDLRPRAGKVTARRLNRAEYNHSIRDLFGLDLRPAETFPSDEVGAGFDNNGDVLSLSPMLMEKYLDAAELIAAKVLIDPASLPHVDQERASDQLVVHGQTRTGSFYGRFLAPGAFVWADFEIPVAGQYRVRVRGGNTSSAGPPTTVAVFDRKGVLRGKDDLGYYGGSGRAESFDFHLTLEPGQHRFYVAPLERAEQSLEVGQAVAERFAQVDPDLIAAAIERQKQPLRPDRDIDDREFPFMVRGVSVEGPSSHPADAFPPSQQAILRRLAKQRDDRWHDVDDSARECLRPLMRRAFRGPVSDDEVKRYAGLVSQATSRGDSYYRGLQIAISAVLVSPRFLFRVEVPPPDAQADRDGGVRLTPHQLATRLSYFLWSSTPDEALLSEADRGGLAGAKLDKQVRRMIADPKSDALAEQFAAQWFGLRNLDAHEADTQRFPTFTPSLRQAMSRESQLLFQSLVRENRPVRELLTSDFSFLNEELAAHYGLQGVQGSEFRKVSLQGSGRRGILGHASVLTLSSNPARTSPVKRGKWILENVLGTPPPEPPSGVPELEETKTAEAGASLREQMELHRADPSCAACHRVMDQLGFGLEQFDAIGRYREGEGEVAIDASGELPGGRTFNGAGELSDLLGRTEADAFARTAVERLMTFALGRELSPSDRCTVDEIAARTAANQHQLVDLIVEVVNSRQFQYYDWSEPTSSGSPEPSTVDPENPEARP